MNTASTLFTTLVLLACFNVYAILLIRAVKVSLPLGATAYLAGTPISIVAAASWILLHYGRFVSSGHTLDTVITFKTGATGIAVLVSQRRWATMP